MRCLILFLVQIALLLDSLNGFKDWSKDRSPERWNSEAKATLKKLLGRGLNKNIAKNLIIFLGDGMGISTVTAGRIRKGQLQGNNGEETITNMESLPNLGLAKTYNIDSQTPDSAGTATAFLCGVKTSAGIIGLNGHARTHDCPSSLGNEIDSILKWAFKANKSVGVVTTTRITHATPAASYAHSAFRDWEAYDGIKFTRKQSIQGCKDIAAQLIDDNSFINVALGGGRVMFLPNTTFDYVQENARGHRIDGRHLINEWTKKMSKNKKRYKFIYNASDFRNTNFKEYDHILGLLSFDNLKYESDRIEELEPSLAEMTQKAIELLSQNKNGYFLLVEGGRIDHGHHENKAHKALDDYVMFDEAIGEALKLVREEDTMIVATADHSHTFSLGGNSMRGNPVYGIALTKYTNISDANLTYTSILYGNGPGGLKQIRSFNLTNEKTEHVNYTQEAVVYKRSATHAAEDVAIYASGPMSFLFSNTVEQNFITHAMAYSACIGPYSNAECRRNRGALVDTTRALNLTTAQSNSSGLQSEKSTFYLMLQVFCFIVLFLS